MAEIINSPCSRGSSPRLSSSEGQVHEDLLDHCAQESDRSEPEDHVMCYRLSPKDMLVPGFRLADLYEIGLPQEWFRRVIDESLTLGVEPEEHLACLESVAQTDSLKDNPQS